MRSGQRVGKYVLGEQIARGGMAEVWAARVEGPGGFVKSLALKFILESFTGDPELERLFLNEARVAAKLQHANLVGVFDFDKLIDPESAGPGRYYIAMERVDGHDLRRVLQVARHNGHRVSPAVALYVAGEVLKGLRYVHERMDEGGHKPLELVHRDVSPHNVLVGIGGEVKLSDFGIAKAMTQSLGTQTGTIRGKLAYASPEQLRGEVADHRADQFGLGVTLWEMLADRRLFSGSDEGEIVGKVLRCEIPPLPANAGIDAAVEATVRRMLAGQVADRFPSTADALSAVLAAPGYVPDGAGLAALMRELFGPRAIAQPPTVPLNLPAPSPVGGLAETSQLERSPSASPYTFSASVSGGGGLVSGLVSGSLAGAVLAASGGGDTGAAPVEPEGIPTRIEPAETVTGSAYVSGESPVVPTWIPEPRVSPRPKRILWAVAIIAVVALGGIGLVARRAEEPTAPAPANVPDGPRPRGAEPVRQVVPVTAPTGTSERTGLPVAVPDEVPPSPGEPPDDKPSAPKRMSEELREKPGHSPPIHQVPPAASGPSDKIQRNAVRRNRPAKSDGRREHSAPKGPRRARGGKGAAANAAPVLE